MNIHEYQAKEIFKRYGIPIHEGRLAGTPQEAYKIAQEIAEPNRMFAVKAQVHAGGRGKGGGIKIVKSPEEVRDAASKILGHNLVTPQTGPEGKPVHLVLIETTSPLAKEYYASVILDRSAAKPCLIASEAGGMEIEEVAAKAPEKILKQHFCPEKGLSREEAQRLAEKLIPYRRHSEAKPKNLALDPSPPSAAQDDGESLEMTDSNHTAIRQSFSQIFQSLSKLFLELDASLVEINPLAVMSSGEVVAIDAKINFDVNALYRHPEIAALRDPTQEDPREVEAKKFDLSYVGLDGNIGCIVNGAGLAMATMDIIKYAGGEPANFLDVGGGASKEKVAAAFKIILQDPKVKAILVNIFGGILRCDMAAEGILAAVKEVGVKVPLVVRLEGTNEKEGKEILKRSGLNIIPASGFAEAAEKVVAAL